MRTPQRRFAAVFMALALLATACGGASEPLTPEAAAAAAANASATEAAAAAAEANIQLLAGGTTPFDFEVLNVHDGSISSVEEVVDGDRAVLLWFFSPHWPTCQREAPEIEQFARENEDIVQVVGLGTQDDFEFAQRFLERGEFEETTLLWDPSFDTWRALGVQANSQFVLLAPDLSTGTDLVYGFNDEVQTELVSVLSDLDL